jgi:hypothetical protein
MFGDYAKDSMHALLSQILSEVRDLKIQIQEFRTMSSNSLSALQAQVAANTTVITSAETLIQGIKAALDAAIASGNPAALDALSAQLGTDDSALAAAVAANTPTPPAPASAARKP